MAHKTTKISLSSQVTRGRGPQLVDPHGEEPIRQLVGQLTGVEHEQPSSDSAADDVQLRRGVDPAAQAPAARGEPASTRAM